MTDENIPGYEAFATRVGATFDVVSESGQVGSLELAECSPFTSSGGYGSYTLTFTGNHQAGFGQGTYAFSMAGMDPFHLFIVPTGATDDIIQYEAVFNQKEG